jgi:hypothetical protein
MAGDRRRRGLRRGTRLWVAGMLGAGAIGHGVAAAAVAGRDTDSPPPLTRLQVERGLGERFGEMQERRRQFGGADRFRTLDLVLPRKRQGDEEAGIEEKQPDPLGGVQ